MQLIHEFDYQLDIDGPAAASDGSSPSPRRTWWEMKKATLKGPRLSATSLMPGIDWFTPMPNGFGRPHVRLPFRTDDGALVLLEYHGIVHATSRFNDAVARDEGTEWSDQYMRMAMFFETESPRYAWLMESMFIARGRLRGAKVIEYQVFRLE
ncbi:DUF3237 domain-containing protein [Variovorax sp. KK3]|uniref:DUF3237 domain-containing protein n=1 Tax=Variovorax sp. KK3 TaxID=1855728 RepID=UPI00097C026E|nr:DUF3237 domain-containing protein [Variovorax sp. KK3]